MGTWRWEHEVRDKEMKTGSSGHMELGTWSNEQGNRNMELGP